MGDLAPAITVVVPSHERRLRLRWLLNALEEQTLERARWEVVVVHTYDDRDTRDVLDRHPLAADGTLRHHRIPRGEGSPARQRNIGWRDARAPLVAFTDDDCRPDPRWLEELLAVAREHPGAIVQGATRSDPLEVEIAAAPHRRSMHVDPPGPFAQTCNILYPKAVLEACGGLDEAFPGPAGEDADLAIRARGAGTPYAGAPGAVVYHAIEEYTLAGMLRLNLKWRDVAYLVKRHPNLRDEYALRIFWRPTHHRLLLALAGAALGRRFPPALALAWPYVAKEIDARGTRKSARLASAAELPGRVVVHLGEIAALAWGSAKHRTLVL